MATRKVTHNISLFGWNTKQFNIKSSEVFVVGND